MRFFPAHVLLLALAFPAAAAIPVKVGIYQNSPKVFIDKQGSPAGFFVDILNTIAAKENWALQYMPCDWDECLDKLAAAELDVMLDVAYSSSRAKRFDFNKEAVISSWSIVYQREGMNIDSILDLDMQRVAVLKGSIQYNELKTRTGNFAISPVYLEVDAFDDALTLIDQHKADFALLNRFYGNTHMADHGLIQSNVLVKPSVLKFATPKDTNRHLIEAIDRQLLALKHQKSSVYYSSIEKWLTVNPGNYSAVWVKWVLAGLSLLLFILLAVVLLIRIILARKSAQLGQLESLLKSAINSTPDLIFFKDKAGFYLGCNSAFEAFTGKKRSEITGKTDNELFDSDVSELFMEKDKEMLETCVTRQNEEWVTYPDGHRVLLDTLRTPFYDSNKNIIGVLSVSRDITERKKIESELVEQKRLLDRLAHHDTLTELPNRLLFSDRLSQAIHNANRSQSIMALLFIDLDNFKKINDSLGHSVGDELLQQVSISLPKSTREGDIVARLGGDEFTIIAGSLKKPQDAAIIAQKLVNLFQSPFILKDHQLHITASIGISIYPNDGKDAEELLRNADSAMYRAKSEGRNNFQFYTEDMTEQALNRVQMESDLRTAIEHKQFVLNYQPLYELNGAKLIGAEALIRWEHPKLGRVDPDNFIPMAEDTGQIRQIGSWVIHEVCSNLQAWIAGGYRPVRVAINVSGKQLIKGDRSLLASVQTILDDTGCDPRLIGLEITEGSVMHSHEQSIEDFQKLQALGVEISIDDFGTGYSSLSLLKQLPINKLKIDRTFIRDIPDDPNDLAITRAVIAMGKSLQLKVLAEGVENEVQKSFLEQEACDEVQGFYFSKPLPEKEFLELLEKQV